MISSTTEHSGATATVTCVSFVDYTGTSTGFALGLMAGKDSLYVRLPRLFSCIPSMSGVSLK